MTHVRVTQYIESWLGKSVMQLHPGIYPYLFVQDMFGEEFIQERLADGSMVEVQEETHHDA